MRKKEFVAALSMAVCFNVVAQGVSTAEIQEVPGFINLSANHIILPSNADSSAWKKLAHDIVSAQDNDVQIDIMHIGDSHIQAEMGTSRLRERLQARYGNGGRGLITAFKLAGTNQPVDYKITSTVEPDKKVRLLKQPWEIKPGFTGVASSAPEAGIITYQNLKEGHDFDYAEIFTSRGRTSVTYPEVVDSGIYMTIPEERVYGVYTRNTSKPGLVYSTIGNNGACFSDYLLIDGFAESVAHFAPRLIILSMGTNEGYSTMTDEEIESTTEKLIHELKQANPSALFMIWTPMECEKKNEKEKFKINKRVKEARDIIANVAVREGIALWDFYEVAGGDKSARRWVEAEMMNPRDHVHLLGAGYRLQGDLAADALIEFLETGVK
ncbi:MAG: hypothetical protein J1F20_07040 [Muribaculaceae bacterium]|nr:hypothetical protein [Muribaculaceae bacterium]